MFFQPTGQRQGVFHYDRHMRYQLNYHSAQDACVQDFGGKIATRDQLEKALKSGLEECRAGWITSAEVAYPRINKHWNCGENKTGIISYGIRQNLHEKWDVFCYKEDDDCSLYDRAFFKVSLVTTESPSRSMFPTNIPVTHELSFTSTSPATIFPLLSSNTVPKKEHINSSLPTERNQSDTRKTKGSEDQEENNFESYFPSVNFSEHNESLNGQEVVSFNTIIELNGTSDAYKVDHKIETTISFVTNLTVNMYAPTSVQNIQTKSHLPTSDKISNVDSSTKAPLNSSIPMLDNVTNSILHETGSNINIYKMMVRKEKFDVLPPSPLTATTENPSYYNKTFIPGKSATTNRNILITTTSKIKTYFPDIHQNKTDLYSADFLSNSQHKGTTEENTFQIKNLQSHTEIVHTMTDNLLSQEHEHPVATTPIAGFTEQHMPTGNRVDVLQLTTDQITGQHRTFFDIPTTTSSHLHYQEKEVLPFVGSKNISSSEPTPTSNLQNESNIDENRDFTRGTLGNQKALTPKETSTSPTTATLSAKMSAEVESTKPPKNIAPTIASLFTPYDHMKVTASPTTQSNVTNLSPGEY